MSKEILTQTQHLPMITQVEGKSASNKQPKKSNIPKALREQVWIKYCGKKFDTKCPVSWCTNRINVFDFEVGHEIPESKGGPTDIHNLKPVCSRCNKSMSNTYTITEWNNLVTNKSWFRRCFCCG